MNTQSNRNLVVGAFRRQRYNLADVALVAAAILTLIFGEYYLALAAMVVIMAILRCLSTWPKGMAVWNR